MFDYQRVNWKSHNNITYLIINPINNPINWLTNEKSGLKTTPNFIQNPIKGPRINSIKYVIINPMINPNNHHYKSH